MESATSAPPRTFDDLFLDQHDRLYRALYFITGSSADAEELMQDAFLKLWERWDRIDAIDDPVAYLFRVAMNGFRMRARRAKLAARRVIHLEPNRDPYDDIELREDVRRMCGGSRPGSARRSCSRRSSVTARNRPPGSLASGRRPCACSPPRGGRRSGEMRRPGCTT